VIKPWNGENNVQAAGPRRRLTNLLDDSSACGERITACRRLPGAGSLLICDANSLQLRRPNWMVYEETVALHIMDGDNKSAKDAGTPVIVYTLACWTVPLC
jgi:hypothetical protein